MVRVSLRHLLTLLGFLVVFNAIAHDARPAYLEIRQTSLTRYNVLWRIPVMAGMPLPVVLRLPEGPIAAPSWGVSAPRATT